MPDSLQLLNTVSTNRNSDALIGWRFEIPVLRGEFLSRVAVWQKLLAHSAGQSFALYVTDAIEFGAALFGAWHAGKTIYLPGDRLAATCVGLCKTVSGFLGEFDSEWRPLTPAGEDEARFEFESNPLSPDSTSLVIYTSGTTGNAVAIRKKLGQLAAEVGTLEST